jgi:hypothetical protein
MVAFFANRSCNREPVLSSPIVRTDVRYDTVYIKRDSIVYKTVIMSNSIKHVGILPKEYQPDPDIAVLTKRFNTMTLDHSLIRIYKDEFPLDSLGSITITDTLQFNKFKGKRGYKFDYKIPIVTKTNTITITNTIQTPAKRQLYIGANVLVDRTLSEGLATGGLLYKDRKDRIFTLNLGTNTTGQLYAGVGSYWKLKI